MIEKQLGPLVNMSRLLGKVAPTCVDAYYRYSCSLAYPKCGENGAGKRIYIYIYIIYKNKVLIKI